MDYAGELTKTLGSNQTLAFLFLIAANVILGMLAAFKDGKFDWNELPNILKKVGLYGGTYVGLSITGAATDGAASGIAQTGTWAAFLPFIRGIMKNARGLAPVEKITGDTIANILAPKPTTTTMQVLPGDDVRPGDPLQDAPVPNGSGLIGVVQAVTPSGDLVVNINGVPMTLPRSRFLWMNPPRRK